MTYESEIGFVGGLVASGLVYFVTTKILKNKVKKEVKVIENVIYPKEEQEEGKTKEGRDERRGIRRDERGREFGRGLGRGIRRSSKEESKGRASTKDQFGIDESFENSRNDGRDEKRREVQDEFAISDEYNVKDNRRANTKDSKTAKWNSISIPDIEPIED